MLEAFDVLVKRQGNRILSWRFLVGQASCLSMKVQIAIIRPCRPMTGGTPILLKKETGKMPVPPKKMRWPWSNDQTGRDFCNGDKCWRKSLQSCDLFMQQLCD